MTFTVQPVHLFTIALMAVLMTVFALLAKSASDEAGEFKYEPTTGINCPYIKVAADDGDRDAQEFYNNNC